MLAAAIVAGVAIAAIGAPQTEEGLLVAAARAIDRHRHRKRARLLGARHHGFCHLPFVGGIELVPDRRAARGGHLLDADAGRGRKDLQVVARLGAARGGNLTLVVERPLPPNRRQHDGGSVPHAQDVDAGVGLAHVDEAARAELEFQEAFAVGAQRRLVIDAGGHIAEMCRRHVLAAYRLEVEDVDRILGRCDQLVGAHRRPGERVRELGPGAHALAGKGARRRARQQRAAREKLQELATARRRPCRRSHGVTLPRCLRRTGASPTEDASYTPPPSRDNPTQFK